MSVRLNLFNGLRRFGTFLAPAKRKIMGISEDLQYLDSTVGKEEAQLHARVSVDEQDRSVIRRIAFLDDVGRNNFHTPSLKYCH
jgi:hypothetical protein